MVILPKVGLEKVLFQNIAMNRAIFQEVRITNIFNSDLTHLDLEKQSEIFHVLTHKVTFERIQTSQIQRCGISKGQSGAHIWVNGYLRESKGNQLSI